MKERKNIEVWSDYDACGNWYLAIKKKKGALKLEEIREIAMDWECDFYALIIDAVNEEAQDYYDWDFEGDFVRLYRATDFLKCEKK